MSGGHFYTTPHAVGEEYADQWHDEELDCLFYDLFGAGWYDRKVRKPEFGRTWAGDHTGGLAEALDLWLSGDIDEDGYREQVARFKAKWLARRTPKDRVEFYQRRFEEHASETMERFKRELGEVVA